MIALGDLVSRAIVCTFRLASFHCSSMATKKCRVKVSMCRAPSCFYLYVTHVINFTRLPRFSACNIEKLREPGDEASETHII